MLIKILRVTTHRLSVFRDGTQEVVSKKRRARLATKSGGIAFITRIMVGLGWARLLSAIETIADGIVHILFIETTLFA